MDKIVIRISILILLIFFLTAIFYERPQPQTKRAAYLPPEGFVGSVETGAKLFAEHCQQCHGNQLQGTEKGPPLIHAYYRPDHHADLAFYLAVYQGVVQHHWQFGDMPAQKQLNAEEADHLLRFIRDAQIKAGLF